MGLPDRDPDDTRDLTSMIADMTGMEIGRYKLLEKIGEGGMATVYMAEQRHPICRRVALKIIKLGMDTKRVIARFEAERQALALMDHPNIATVLDAGQPGQGGLLRDGACRGLPITKFYDANNNNAGTSGVVRVRLPCRPARPSTRDHSPGYQALQRVGYAV